jgi:hypothetical protein
MSCHPELVEESCQMQQFILHLRNEFSYDSFSSIRSLALRAVALEKGKASFFRGIPYGQ